MESPRRSALRMQEVKWGRSMKPSPHYTSEAAVRDALADERFSDSDKWVIKWQFGKLGSFEATLAAAMATASDHNIELLERGFPMQVAGFRAWRDG